MKVAISTNKLMTLLYWTIYLGLCFISGWFASEVVEHYLSRKTSFSQYEEISNKRPVVSIVLFVNSEVKPVFQYETHLIFQYCPTYKTWTPSCKMLQLGENHFKIKEINKTETVFLERTDYENAFRIIPQTNLLDEKAKAFIDVVSLKQLSTVDFRVNFYLTSLENSLGYIFGKWNDGEYLRYEMEKNSAYYFIIKPEKYYYLPQTSKCQQESYHQCLALELEKLDFNQTSCIKKCTPSIFSYGNNSTSICQNLEEHECAKNVVESIIDNSIVNYSTKPKFASRCKHSCEILQYSGMEIKNRKKQHYLPDLYDVRQFYYEFANSENKMKAYQEYLIHDAMGMIGSVGGTLGMFIGFSMTGVISWTISYLKKFTNPRKIFR